MLRRNNDSHNQRKDMTFSRKDAVRWQTWQRLESFTIASRKWHAAVTSEA